MKTILRIPRAGTHAIAIFWTAAFFAALASAQTIPMFPKNYQRMWTRVAIPPSHPLSPTDQWLINAKPGEIACDGNQGHEWLRFNHELADFEFKVEWRFVPVPGTAKFNSGVFFRNSEDGTIWHQAQTSLAGGYIFAETPVDGKLTRVNLQKEMTKNRVKPAGQWNAYDIRCVGGACTLAVNGRVVNTLHLSIDEGYVGLEAEGSSITFRHLRLQQLP
ncbi:MAG: 3-keto-disaccharide hydrolase [Terracidiphilus sp.]